MLSIEKSALLLVKRREKDLTQEEVAKEIGCHRQHYSRIERGTVKPSPKVAQNIGKVLGVDWTMFFEE